MARRQSGPGPASSDSQSLGPGGSAARGQLHTVGSVESLRVHDGPAAMDWVPEGEQLEGTGKLALVACLEWLVAGWLLGSVCTCCRAGSHSSCHHGTHNAIMPLWKMMLIESQ